MAKHDNYKNAKIVIMFHSNEDGRYYKTVPQPPCINIVDFEGYTGPLDENGLPVGLAAQIARANEEEGRDTNEAQIIIKRHAPPDSEPPHKK